MLLPWNISAGPPPTGFFNLKALCTNMLQIVKIESYSKLHLGQVHHIFFSIGDRLMALITHAQSAPKWPAGYKWTLYVSYALHYHIRELVQRKGTMFWLLHSKLLYTYNRWGETMIIILKDVRDTGKKYIYIAHFQHVYFFKLYIIQHLAG